MEILNTIQKEALGLFAKISDSGHFYLTGGTALSYFYLRHRKSNDLDLFTVTEELILPLSHTLEETLKDKKMMVRRQRGMHSFVELLIEQNNEKTVIHLACDSPYRIGELKTFPEYPNLKVDNLIDISTNKLLALFGRAALRDFIDIYEIEKQKDLAIENFESEIIEKTKFMLRFEKYRTNFADKLKNMPLVMEIET